MTEDTVVICNPTKWGPPHVASLIKECADCGQSVHISLGTFRGKPANSRILCVPCAIKVVTPESEHVLLPETLEEMTEYLSKNKT